MHRRVASPNTNRLKENDRPSAIDLFCGAGGVSLGLHAAGFEVLFAADCWDPAINSYKRNFDHPVCKVDLSTMSACELWNEAGLEPRPVDLLVGGPPCQGFSIQRVGSDRDSRNDLVLEFARLAAEFQPRLFIMENVPGLLGARGTKIAAEFEQRLIASGYEVEAVQINAAEYGVPQLRKRVFFIGWRFDAPRFSFPEPTINDRSFQTVLAAIGDLASPPTDHTPSPDDPLHRRTRLSSLNQQRIRLIPPGGGMQDLPREMRVQCHKNGASRIGHRNVYGRLAPNRPAGTITARFDSFTRGKFGHPVEPRNITLREGARLQTFPDSFQFAGTQEEIAALIGNAVPPTLAKCVATTAFRYLSEDEVEPSTVGPLRTAKQPTLFSESE